MRTGLARALNRLYDPMLFPLEVAGLTRARGEVAREVEGRVLEIGIGTGLNLRHYERAERLVGVDPTRDYLEVCRGRSSSANLTAALVQGRSEELPFEQGSFDSVVGTLFLCTVEGPAKALREISRVLRPGGRAHLLEHVRWDRAGGRVQDLLAPIWKLCSGGCRLNQRTPVLLAESPLRTIEERRHWGGLLVHWVAEAR